MLQLSPSRRANLLAGATILLLLTAFSAILYFGSRETSIVGPSSVAVSNNSTVYFRAGDNLYGATADGKLQYSASLQELRLGRYIADLEVMNDQLLVADGENHTIVWCKPDLTECPQETPLPPVLHSRVFYFAPVPQEHRFYVTSTSQHRLDAIDFTGAHQYRVQVSGGLLFPNEVRVLSDKTIVVADTNHHRIVGLEDRGKGHSGLAWAFKTETDLRRAGRVWPVAVKQGPDGQWWVVNGDNGLTMGDIVRFTPTGKPVSRIELGSSSDPSGLARAAGHMLITDFGDLRLLNVDPSSGKRTDFAQGDLENALTKLRQKRAHWTFLKQLGWVLAAVGLLLGVIAALLDSQARKSAAPARKGRAPGQPSKPVTPDANNVLWLESDPRVFRILRLAMAIIGLITVVLILPAIVLANDMRVLLLPLLPMMLLTMGVYFFIYSAFKRQALGTDGRYVYLRDMRGKSGKLSPREFVVTRTRLVGAHIAIAFRNNAGQYLFDPEQFEVYLRPVIAQAETVSELGLWLRRLKAGDSKAWLLAAATLLPLSLLLWLRFS